MRLMMSMILTLIWESICLWWLSDNIISSFISFFFLVVFGRCLVLVCLGLFEARKASIISAGNSACRPLNRHIIGHLYVGSNVFFVTVSLLGGSDVARLMMKEAIPFSAHIERWNFDLTVYSAFEKGAVFSGSESSPFFLMSHLRKV